MRRLAMALAGIIALGSAAACRDAGAVARVPTIRLRLAQDPVTLDPAHAADQHSVAVVSQIFDGLVRLDPSDLSVKPALAGSWEVSADGLRHTFHRGPTRGSTTAVG